TAYAIIADDRLQLTDGTCLLNRAFNRLPVHVSCCYFRLTVLRGFDLCGVVLQKIRDRSEIPCLSMRIRYLPNGTNINVVRGSVRAFEIRDKRSVRKSRVQLRAAFSVLLLLRMRGH